MNQHALAWSDLGAAMQHLVRRHVGQNETDGLGGVQARRYRNQVTLRKADKLRVRATDRERGDDLAWRDSRGAGAHTIDLANEIPPWREGQRGCLGMNALAHHHVWQAD